MQQQPPEPQPPYYPPQPPPNYMPPSGSYGPSPNGLPPMYGTPPQPYYGYPQPTPPSAKGRQRTRGQQVLALVGALIGILVFGGVALYLLSRSNANTIASIPNPPHLKGTYVRGSNLAVDALILTSQRAIPCGLCHYDKQDVPLTSDSRADMVHFYFAEMSKRGWVSDSKENTDAMVFHRTSGTNSLYAEIVLFAGTDNTTNASTTAVILTTFTTA